MEVITSYSLTKTYKDKMALSNVNINIKKGDIYGLIGKNGAGKTTLMRIVAGLTFATSGSFSLFGETDQLAIAKNRSKIGAIIESPALFLNYNARNNLKAIAILKGIKNIEQKIDQMLDFAGLTDVGNKKVKNFSLGMKQRLAIAMALIDEPELLILDEPVNGLDPVGIVEMRNILKRINQETGTTIVISSHLLSELSHLATKYGIIHQGELIEEISADQLHSKLDKTLDITLSDKLDMPKAAELLKDRFNTTNFDLQGHTIVLRDRAVVEKASEINKLFAEANILIRNFTTQTTDLEKYFVNLTKGGNKNV